MRIKINHESAIQGAHWCEPIGWQPANEIEGAEWLDGAWWGADCEDAPQAAALVYFGEAEEDDEIDANEDDLRVASCGDCRVIGRVLTDAETTFERVVKIYDATNQRIKRQLAAKGAEFRWLDEQVRVVNPLDYDKRDRKFVAEFPAAAAILVCEDDGVPVSVGATDERIREHINAVNYVVEPGPDYPVEMRVAKNPAWPPRPAR